MARTFHSPYKGHQISVYLDNAKHEVSVAKEAQDTDRRHQVSVLKSDTVESSDRRVTGQLTVTEKLPNLFYGFSEISGGSIEIDNEDGEYNFLLSEEARGQPVRLRRVDEFNTEDDDIFVGIIETYDVGDKIIVQIASHELEVFEQELPLRRILTKSSTTTPASTDVVIDEIFPNATDVNAPINVVLGRVPKVRCQLVRSDDVAEEYDYLVCENEAAIEAASKGGFRTYEETGDCLTAAVEVDDLYLDPATASAIPTFYDKMYARLMKGAGAGQERKIVGYDEYNSKLTISPAWNVYPTTTTSYEIGEYSVQANTTYPRRTAIRFRTPARDTDGNLMEVRATTVRFRPVLKNLLRFTERMYLTDQYDIWVALGTDVTSTINVAMSPDGLVHASEVYLPVNNGLQQVSAGDINPGASDDYVFSVWARLLDSHPTDTDDIELHIYSLGGSPVDASSSKTISKTWTRISMNRIGAGQPYGSNLYIGILGKTGSAPFSVLLWGAQLESGTTPTDYEPVEDTNQGFLWSFADAVRELLKDPVYGLSQVVDEASFDTVRDTMWNLNMKCQGTIPAIDGGGGLRAKDILDSLMHIYGMWLSRTTGAWKLEVDSTKSTVGTLGSAETQYQNLTSVAPVRKPPSSEDVKNIILKYNSAFTEDNESVTFRGELSKTVSETARGKDVTVEHRFIRDDVTADHAVQYLAAKMKLLAETRQATVGQAARRGVTLNDRITLLVPRLMVENYVKYSENLTVSPWGFMGGAPDPTVTLVDGRNQYYRAQSLSQIDFPTGNVARLDVVKQTLAEACANRKATATFWARVVGSYAVSENMIAFSIFNTNLSTGVTEAPILGKSWKKIQLSFRFPAATTGDVLLWIWRDNTVSDLTAISVQISRVQVAYEYDYQYVKTEGITHPADVDWQVIELTREDVNSTKLLLMKYTSTVFDFTATSEADEDGTIDPAEVSLDLLATPPTRPVNLTVPPFPFESASAGVIIEEDDDGVPHYNAWGIFQVELPDDENVIEIELQKQLRKKGSGNFLLDPNDEDWEWIGRYPKTGVYKIPTAELGTTVDIRIEGFQPGIYPDSTLVEGQATLSSQRVWGAVGVSLKGSSIAHVPASQIEDNQAVGVGPSFEIELTVPAGGIAAGSCIVVSSHLFTLRNDSTCSCADDQTNSYTLITEESGAPTVTRMFVALDVTALSAGEKITLTFDSLSSGLNHVAVVNEFTGILAVGAIDKQCADEGRTNKPSVFYGELSTAVQLLVMAGHLYETYATTVSPDFRFIKAGEATNGPGTTNGKGWQQYRIDTEPVTPDESWWIRALSVNAAGLKTKHGYATTWGAPRADDSF